MEIRLIAGLWRCGGAKNGGWKLAACDLMGYGSMLNTMDLWDVKSHGHKSLMLLAMSLRLSRLIVVKTEGVEKYGRVAEESQYRETEKSKLSYSFYC